MLAAVPETLLLWVFVGWFGLFNVMTYTSLVAYSSQTRRWIQYACVECDLIGRTSRSVARNKGRSRPSLISLIWNNPFPSILSVRGIIQAFTIVFFTCLTAILFIGIWDLYTWVLSPFGALFELFSLYCIVSSIHHEYHDVFYDGGRYDAARMDISGSEMSPVL